MATNLLNCTVTTYSSLEFQGDTTTQQAAGAQLESQIITDPVIQAAVQIQSSTWDNNNNELPVGTYVLIITPDPGFTISAEEINLNEQAGSAVAAQDGGTCYSWSGLDILFSGVQTVPAEVSTVTVKDSTTAHALGNVVVATVNISGFEMPANDVTINIDFDGAAIEYQPPESPGSLKITPIGRMLDFFYSDCAGFIGDTSLIPLNTPCDPDSEFSNQGVFVTGIISDENGNEYHTHNNGPDFLNQDSEASTLIPNNFYGPTHINYGIDGSSGFKSIKFDLEEGDGVLNGNLPQYVYIKFVAFAFSGETFQECDACPDQPVLPHTPLYINPDNCRPLLQNIGDVTAIGNYYGEDGTYFPESDMAPFVFSSSIIGSGFTDNYLGQQLLLIENYEVTEIFPTEGYGTETNAVLVRLELNPNYVFSENLFQNTRLGIALTGLTNQNADGETLTGGADAFFDFYSNSYNYLSFDSFTDNGVGFNINIIDEQG